MQDTRGLAIRRLYIIRVQILGVFQVQLLLLIVVAKIHLGPVAPALLDGIQSAKYLKCYSRVYKVKN